MAKILIPTPLRQYADRKDSVQIGGATVGEALTALTGQYQELRRHLYNDEGKLRSFVNVYVNEEDIRYLKKEATPLNESDTVSIVPSIAGGAVDTLASNRERDRATLGKFASVADQVKQGLAYFGQVCGHDADIGGAPQLQLISVLVDQGLYRSDDLLKYRTDLKGLQKQIHFARFDF